MEKEQKKEVEGEEKKPSISFRTFMVHKMEEGQYQKFVTYCKANGMNFAPAITMLMTHWEFTRTPQVEEKPQKKARFGSE